MTSFTELPLSPALQQRLAACQFHTPMPIQSAAIPHALAGKDLMATAHTGTGKTLAFLVPMIERLLQSPRSRTIEALVLVPTRELAMQVHEQFGVHRRAIGAGDGRNRGHVRKTLRAADAKLRLCVA